MRHTTFLALLVAALLMISLSECQGFGRKTLGSFGHGHSHRVLLEEKSKAMYQADYEDPGPNFNYHSGFLTSPPSPLPEDMN